MQFFHPELGRPWFSTQDINNYLHQLDSIPLSNVRELAIPHFDKPGCKKRPNGDDNGLQLQIATEIPSKRLKTLADSTFLQSDTLIMFTRETSSSSHTSSPGATYTPYITIKRPRPSVLPIHRQRQASIGEHRSGPEYAHPRAALQISLVTDEPVSEHKFLTEKAKEKEYWRRQRRVFVRSRFITKDEATTVANSVYGPQNVNSNHRIVDTFQANIANFRSKWRKILKEVAPTLGITKVDLKDLASCEERINSMLDKSMLEWIWGHWIANPFVHRQAFYDNEEAVLTLTLVTAKALLVTLRHIHSFLRQRGFRKELDDLDKYTRTIYLPDPQQ